jgi:hypothetical protein
MDSLENCYEKLRTILGNEIEPIRVLRIADAHRRFWRPERVKTILLAESHVYTNGEEAARTIQLPTNISSSVPQSFVRLVYCLGYGENGLLQNPIKNPPNSGTWQFWQVFHGCVNRVNGNEDFAGVQKTRTPDLCQRIRNKLQLLEKLKQKGIWLVDGSLAALYLPGRNKPSPEILEQALQTSWDFYVCEQVIQAKPEQIICIGHGVWRSLAPRLKNSCQITKIELVKQPNARMNILERFKTFNKYFEICSGIANEN